MFRSEVNQTALRLSGAHLVPRGEIPVLRPHQIAREDLSVNQDLCDLGSVTTLVFWNLWKGRG